MKGTARTTGSGSCTQIFETTLRVAWRKSFDPPTNDFKIGYTEKKHKNPTVYRVSPLLHALMRSRGELKRCTVRMQRGSHSRWGLRALEFHWHDGRMIRQTTTASKIFLAGLIADLNVNYVCWVGSRPWKRAECLLLLLLMLLSLSLFACLSLFCCSCAVALSL